VCAVCGQGTCQELEKEYFRLNEVPHTDTVRPPDILRKALEWQMGR
jgi:hypothetical protein